MAFRRKLTPAARAASVVKSISSAQESAMQAFSSWGRATKKAVDVSERNLAAAARKAARMNARAAKALKRMQRAKAKQVKAVARDARKLAQTELASARATLQAARESHAAAKAAHKLYRLVEQGMASGMQAAEKLAAKAAPRRGLRGRLRRLVS